MSNVNLTCPNCGASIEFGTTSVVVDNVSKAKSRIALLREAGIDTSAMFAMNTGGIARVADGVASIIPEDDDVFLDLRDGGTIRCDRLFRRWVMAQVFHMIDDSRGFTGALRAKGLKYQFRMLEDELNAQAKMHKHGDMQNFRERNRWFNGRVVTDVCKQYADDTRQLRLSEHDVKSMKSRLSAIACADTPRSLFAAFRDFRKEARSFWQVSMAHSFIDAYKGAGAYYTMKNLILFHGCRFESCNERQSVAELERLADLYADREGWRLFGAMKKLIADNGVDVQNKILEWTRR